MDGSMKFRIKGRLPVVWRHARATLLATGALLASAVAFAQERRVPRQPAPEPPPQAITIEGAWGYPCVLVQSDCLPNPEIDWVGLEVAAWRGSEKFVGDFTGEPDRGALEVTIQVPPAQRGDLVMLEVTAQAPEGHTARFTQILDVAHRLQAQAMPDGRVPRSDARPTVLTIMTTALTGLLEEANGGDWRIGEARLHELLPQIDPAQVMRHSVAFQGLVSGALPGAGSVDPNELVASSAAVDAYLADVPEETLAFVFGQFLTGGASAYQPVDFQGMNLSLVPAAAAGTIAFGRREGIRIRMRDPWSLDGGGSSVIDTGLVRGVATFITIHNDSFPHAARLVRFEQPSYESQRFDYDCPGEGEAQAIRVTERHPDMFRRVAVTAGFEFVEYSETQQLSYLPIDGGLVPCEEALPVFDFVRTYALAYPLRGRARGFASPERGPVALQVLNPDPDPLEEDSQFIAGVVDLSTGGVDAPGYDTAGVVRRDPGGVLMLEVDTLPGTLREGQVQMRLEDVRGDGMGAREWVVSTRVGASLDDHMRALVTPAVPLQPGFALTMALLDGAWRSGIDLSVPGATQALTLSFDSVSGQGTQEPPGGPAVPFSWLIQDGRMQASTFALDAQPGVLLPACPPGATDCREVLRRVWVPLRLGTRGDVERLYVIEELWRDDGADLQRESRQLNFYDPG